MLKKRTTTSTTQQPKPPIPTTTTSSLTQPPQLSNSSSTSNPISTPSSTIPNTIPSITPRAPLLGTNSRLEGLKSDKGYFISRPNDQQQSLSNRQQTSLLSSITVFDDYGHAQACPMCCLSRITQPGLKLFYSTCCGKVLCETCKQQVCIAPIRCDPPRCMGLLTRETWSLVPIDEYRFKKECQKRREMARFGSLEQQDFDINEDQVTYEMYCEELQSLLYDHTYGNDELIKDLQITKITMERKYAVQYQRREQRLQQELLREQQLQLLQLQNQHDDNQTINPSLLAINQLQKQGIQINTNQSKFTQDPPHLEQLNNDYRVYKQYAINLDLKLHDIQSWNDIYEKQQYQHFTSIPTLTNNNDSNTNTNTTTTNSTSSTMNDNTSTTNTNTNTTQQQQQQPTNTNQDSTMNNSTTTNTNTSNSTPIDPMAFRKLEQLRQQDVKQRKLEEHWTTITNQAYTSGYVDYTYIPQTTQYISEMTRLQNENYIYHTMAEYFD